MVVKLSS